MKNTIKFFILLVVGICYSCNNSRDKSLTKNMCETMLSVDLDLENSQVSFYDLFDNVSLIPLETKEESFLHRIDKIIFYNDSIFIMDKRQGTIFLFDSNGKYLSKLFKQGGGPDEYFDLSDFTINPYTNNLELLSAYKGIYCYDLNFDFIERIPVLDKGSLVHRFAVVDSCTRVLFNVVRMHNIEVYDICDKKIQGKYFEVPANIRRNTPLGGPFLLECIKKGEALFTQPFSNTVYSVSRSSFTPRYKWDFGKYNFNINKLKPNLSQNEYDDILGSDSFLANNVYSFLSNAENELFYLVQFSFGKRHDIFTVIYEKGSGQYKKIRELEEGISFPYYPVLTEDFMYTIARDTSVINKYLNEKIKKENNIVLDKLGGERNPVILRYKLKK